MQILGIDVGSTTSKCVIIDENKEIIAKSLIKAGAGTKGADLAIEELLKDKNVKKELIECIVSTGYGRKLISNFDYEVSELTCHSKGVHYLFNDARTIIDIGGQDAKVISLDENGKMKDFLMNDKCAAGTGRFLDVMANILFIDINDMGELAKKAENEVKVSSTCTVFAESEVISQLANGVNINDLIKGICNSVAKRVAVLAKRVGINEKVCMSGGVAQNIGVRDAIAKELKTDVLYSDLAQYAGAIGAALYGYEKLERKKGNV